MSQLSDNLSSRRDALGLTVPDVLRKLNEMGFDVAYSTVAGWFNGSRGVRNMEHLKALCEILQTDLDTITSGEMKVVEGKVAVSVARELEGLNPTQQEAVLAVIRSMRRDR